MLALGEKRQGRDDLYFAARVAFLAVRGVIEYDGDLGQMGRCEVRLPQAKDKRVNPHSLPGIGDNERDYTSSAARRSLALQAVFAI